jgi:hypothetical protein
MDDDFHHRLSKCERALFGDDDSSEGLSSRMKFAESTLETVVDASKKIIWLLVAGILVGLLNLLIKPHPTGTSPQSQSVNVGQGKGDTDPMLPTAREYLTTADIAAREKVTERAVTEWIAQGRITPEPVKQGKAWVIAKNFRILPNDSECCGETPTP